MPRLKSLPDDAKIFDVFASRPDVYRPFVDMVERVTRGDSPLSRGERELIGAYVSELNACRLCADIHSTAAREYGVALEGVPPRMAPVLGFVRKLTEDPQRVSDSDVRAMLDAGFSDQAVHDVILVTCIAGFMNRFVFGMGLDTDDAYTEAAGKRAHRLGYLARFMERVDAERKADSSDGVD